MPEMGPVLARHRLELSCRISPSGVPGLVMDLLSCQMKPRIVIAAVKRPKSMTRLVSA